MIEHLLHRYEQDIVSAVERWEHRDNAHERAYIRGTQIGALFLEQCLREILDASQGGRDLAVALEDLAADLVKRAIHEKQVIAEADDVHTKMGYIKALEQGAQEIRDATEEKRCGESDEVVRRRFPSSSGPNPLRPLDDAL